MFYINNLEIKGSDPFLTDTAKDKFDRIRGSKGKTCKEDGSIWEKDTSSHGGEQWKRWPSKKSWQKGKKTQSIWPDGRVRK